MTTRGRVAAGVWTCVCLMVAGAVAGYLLWWSARLGEARAEKDSARAQGLEILKSALRSKDVQIEWRQ